MVSARVSIFLWLSHPHNPQDDPIVNVLLSALVAVQGRREEVITNIADYVTPDTARTDDSAVPAEQVPYV
jgi:hypothetical protein